MFTSFTSYEVSLLIRMATYILNRQDGFANENRTDIGRMRDRLQDEQAKHELKEPDAPITAVQLAPVDLKECEGFPVPPLMDSTEKSPPPTEPNLGAQYHLLRFLDALRASPEGKVLAPATNAELCEFMSGAMMTLINVDAADDAITDFLGVTFRKIQIELERE